jgi:Gluconate 2-dehydrogenase subunit 3
MSMPTSRRSIIRTIATAAVAGPLGAQHEHHTKNEFVQLSGTKATYQPKVFTKDELETIRLLVDLIIPRTDTPGASDAGVHKIIDSDVSRNPAAQKRWRDGLAWIDKEARASGGKPYRTLDSTQQTAILTSASEAADTVASRFFTLLKSATVDAYYSTREGLQKELGWNGNTFLAEFKGCTHKEHQG